MPKRIDEKTIGDTTYQMTSLGMATAQDVILALAHPLAAFLAGATAASGDLDLEDPESVLRALSAGLAPALRDLTKDELRFVTREFTARTKVKIVDAVGGGRERWVPLAPIYDEHFDGAAEEWVQWIAWGITMNRLFGSALERWSAFRAEAERKRASQKDATGSAGDSSPTPA